MGDRCYMEVHCLRKDKHLFEDDLGFVDQVDPDDQNPVALMICEEANYAYSGRLPDNIPFLASHGPGECYGSGRICCDGKKSYEIEASGSDPVVHWDESADAPSELSVEEVRRYLEAKAKVVKLFADAKAEARKKLGANPNS